MKLRFDQRRNLAMAITVEIGAATLVLAGPNAACDYLLDNGTPPEVAARILGAGQPRGAGAKPDAETTPP